MSKVSPNDGGCWFCQTDETKEGWLFSTEWDSNFHASCCLKALEEGNPEAEIVYHEFKGFTNVINSNGDNLLEILSKTDF